jgi:hypothetical protein
MEHSPSRYRAEKNKGGFFDKDRPKSKGIRRNSFSEENLNVDQSITVIPPPVLDRTVGLA